MASPETQCEVGHEPKDSPQVVIGPYEALNQLVTISQVFRRLEEAAP